MRRRETLPAGLFWLLLLAVLGTAVGALRLRLGAEQDFGGSAHVSPSVLPALPRCYSLVFDQRSGDLPAMLGITPEAAGDRVPIPHWFVAEASTRKLALAWWAQLHADSVDAIVLGWPIGLRVRVPIRGGVGRARLSGDAITDWPMTGAVLATPAPCPANGLGSVPPAI